MKLCPTCKSQYPEDANFCPQEACATPEGPQRLLTESQAHSLTRFQLGDPIGGSRTGPVYRAEDKQTGATVAYKLISIDVLGSPAAFARSEREFKQLSKVSSPKIATIIDCVRIDNGKLAVAMEFCEGVTLERIIAAGPIEFEKAKAYVLQIGQALLEAQKAGLVHRAIAPKNILITSTDDVKVINFAVAKVINDKVAGETQYISPEQIQGKPLDQRSNTYSLAALLYHAVTGEPPFQAASDASLLDLHLTSPLLPPSQRRPEMGLPEALDRLLLKGMDKSSSRRHLTLRLFLSELESIKHVAPRPMGTDHASAPVPLAKTMMFAGSQSDVARMVAEAKAAKAATSPTAAGPVVAGSLVTAPRHATPLSSKPQPAPHHEPIGVMPTIAATVPVEEQVTPLPRSPTPVPPSAEPVAEQPKAKATLTPEKGSPVPREAAPADSGKVAAGGKAPSGKAGAAFRETLWFKKGDVEQMVADAKAKLQGAGKPATEAPPAEIPEDSRPLEDRYVDDGSVTNEDRKKFSLRTGGTAVNVPAASASIPGEKINEHKMVEEIGRGRKVLVFIVVFAILLALSVVAYSILSTKELRPESDVTSPPVPAEPVAPAIPASPPAPAKPEPEPAAIPVKEAPEAAPDKAETAPVKPAKAAADPTPSKKASAKKKSKRAKRARAADRN